MNIPLLDLSRVHQGILEEMQEAVKEVVAQGAYILGPNLAAFEKETAAYLGTRHCVGVSSGTDALLLSLLVMKRLKGQGKVITTPFTFIATAEAIAMAGFDVVFADVDPESGLMDLESVARHLDSSCRGIIPVHLFGQCVDMDGLLGLASSQGAFVLEDVAQAMGARYNGQQAGSMGIAGCFSFFPSKTLGGAGDGGMICTNDDSVAELLRAGRRHGASRQKYLHDFLAGNYRLDEIQAALLRVKLRSLDRWNEMRMEVGALYADLFEDAGLLGSGRVRLLSRMPESSHVFHQFVIAADERDALAAHLKSHGISTAVYYPVPLHVQPAFADLNLSPEACPGAMRLSEEVLALPIFPGLTRQEQEEVVARIASFYGQQ